MCLLQISLQRPLQCWRSTATPAQTAWQRACTICTLIAADSGHTPTWVTAKGMLQAWLGSYGFRARRPLCALLRTSELGHGPHYCGLDGELPLSFHVCLKSMSCYCRRCCRSVQYTHKHICNNKCWTGTDYTTCYGPYRRSIQRTLAHHIQLRCPC